MLSASFFSATSPTKNPRSNARKTPVPHININFLLAGQIIPRVKCYQPESSASGFLHLVVTIPRVESIHPGGYCTAVRNQKSDVRNQKSDDFGFLRIANMSDFRNQMSDVRI